MYSIEYLEELAPNTWLRHYLFEKSNIYSEIVDKKILDVGSGTGVFIKRLLKHTNQVDCLDLSQENLASIKKSHPSVGIIHGNCESLPQIENSMYDRILCSGVIEHFRNPKAALGELIRILKPGGVLYITTSPWPKVTGFIQKRIIAYTVSCVANDDLDLHWKSMFSSKKHYFYWDENILIEYLEKMKVKLQSKTYSGNILVHLFDNILLVIEKLTRKKNNEYNSIICHEYRLKTLPVRIYCSLVLPLIIFICRFNNSKLESYYCLLKFYKKSSNL